MSENLSPLFRSSKLYSRELLDVYLSRALGVELENGRLTSIDDTAYVLTMDYTIKMLNIHERSILKFQSSALQSYWSTFISSFDQYKYNCKALFWNLQNTCTEYAHTYPY